MIFYFSEKKDYSINAGGKAPADIDWICSQLGYIPIYFPHREAHEESVLKKMDMLACVLKSWFKTFLKVKKNDIIIYQYPMCAMPIANKLIPILNRRKIKIISIVHDLSSLRYREADISKKQLRYYIQCDNSLKHSYKIIAHNSKMKQYLISQGISDKTIECLGLFDYLCNDNQKDSVCDFKSIAIAGNLNPQKSGYVYKLAAMKKAIRIYLYGPNYNNSFESQNIIYKGSFEADELPEHMIAGFGLVWDGPDLDTCSGSLGQYLKFNNPHKFSMYLASNMPIIIWKKAALADFVFQNNIGIVIESLEDIGDCLNAISSEEYVIMRKNASELGELVRRGHYTREALSKCIN